MVHKGKVVKVMTGHKDHGKICGSEDGNGMPGCNQADTTLFVLAYLDDLMVPTTPLPMGLCCQTPPRFGIWEMKDLLARATSTTPCMQPCGTPSSEKMTDSITQQPKTVKSKCCCVIQ